MIALRSLLESELTAAGVGRLEHYLGAMSDGFESNPPPFAFAEYGDHYRRCAVNPYWLIQSLISNSVKEGDGARDLWKLTTRIEDDGLRAQVVQHARDEARHARLYIGILRTVFPHALSKEDERYILDRAPRFDVTPPAPVAPHPLARVVDLIVQINLGEFRTRLHQLLMMPVLDCLCSGRETRLAVLMESIARDELQHLAYTAEVIDRWMGDGNGPEGRRLVASRLQQFNALTTREVGEQMFH